MDVIDELKLYIEKNILPQYEQFDGGHNTVHVTNVIKNALAVAAEYGTDINMVYAAAAYHDLGLDKGREEHNLRSAEYLREDKQLKKWFAPDEIEIMAQAVEDHRASSKNEPRSLYGKIVADADREYTVERFMYRSASYGKKHCPELDEEGHAQRMFNKCMEKFGPNGYMHFHLKSQTNDKELMRLRKLLEDKEAFFAECKKYL